MSFSQDIVLSDSGYFALHSFISDHLSEQATSLHDAILRRPKIVVKGSEENDPLCQMTIELENDAARYTGKDTIRSSGSATVFLQDARLFLRALTGIDMTGFPVPIDEVLPLVEARIPSSLSKVLCGLSSTHHHAFDDTYTPMRLTLSHEAIMLSCCAWATTENWLRFLHHPSVTFDGYAKELTTTLTLPIPCKVGDIEISLELLKTLSSGDIVFIDLPLFDTAGTGRVAFRGTEYSVRICEGNSSCKMLFQIEETKDFDQTT